MLTSPSLRTILHCLACGMGLLAWDAATSAPPPRSNTPTMAAARWQGLADTVFHHLNERDLPHQIVTAMVEDEDGFLWVGTQGGLARWDGYRAKVYAPKAGDNHSLPDNWISGLHLDGQKRLWIGTAGGGLVRYDRLQDRFLPVPVGLNGISHVAVNGLANDAAGGLWVATEGGLDRLAPEQGASAPVLHLRHDAQDPGSLPSDSIGVVQCIGDELWVGTSKGLVHRPLSARGNGGFLTVALADVGVDGVSSLLQASDGRLWIGTRNHGALVLEKGSSTARRSMETGQAKVSEWIYQMTEPQPGEIWLGTYGQGIIVVDVKTGQQKRITADPLQPDSLTDDIIWSFYKGRAGQLWIGTGRGLNRVDTGQNAISTLYGSKQRGKALSDNTVMSVAVMPDGLVWLGTSDTGVDILDPLRGRVGQLRPDAARPARALQRDSVFAIWPARKDSVMLGTNRGLYRASRNAKEVSRQNIPGRSDLESVRVLMPEGENWWVGGDIDGLWRLGLPLPAAMPALTDLRITALEATSNGMWIGTAHGLNRYDAKNNRASFFLPNPNDSSALFSGNISSMLTDRRGRLWIGTLGGGVHLLKSAGADNTPQFSRVGMEQGLPNLNVNKLLEDDAGAIWASTDDGLARIDPDSLSVRALQRADGVMISGYMTNSGARTANGELLFGGPGGLTVVRPERIREWTWPAHLVLTDVRVGGKVILSNRFNVPLPRALNKTDMVNADNAAHAMGASSASPGSSGTTYPPPSSIAPLEIQPEANNLAVEFAALDFTAPELNRYAYQLEGYDAGWIETDASRRLAVYTNLPPGEYRLRIRGSNRAGLWNETELVVPLRVHPAWFQCWWWYATQILLVGLILVTLIQLRTRFLRMRQSLLEQTVTQRTQELSEKQQQLQSANMDLQQANLNLALAADTLRDLGDVGREITANLDAIAVFTSLSRHVGNLLDVGTLTIYRFDQESGCLCLAWGRALYGGEQIDIEQSASPIAQAVREQQEVLLDRHGMGLAPKSETPLAFASQPHPEADRINFAENPSDTAEDDDLDVSLCVPLIVDQRVLGVMAIQATHATGFSERERLIFRSLCAYGAIALANAQALQALHQAQAQLLQQEKLAALGGLVTGVAHEINTPLGVVLSSMSGVAGIWQSLQSALASGKTSRAEFEAATRDGLEFTRLALHNGARAAELVASFKAIAARFESDRAEQLDLNEYLHEVAELVRQELEHAGHRLQIHAPVGLHISTVPAALTEVISRILVNVRDHAFAVGQSGILTLRARRVDERSICIEVEDNGTGIASNDLPHVFDPFFTTQSGQGGHVGLGLTVAYSHVSQRLNGKIEVKSAENGGTCVLIFLPIR